MLSYTQPRPPTPHKARVCINYALHTPLPHFFPILCGFVKITEAFENLSRDRRRRRRGDIDASEVEFVEDEDGEFGGWGEEAFGEAFAE